MRIPGNTKIASSNKPGKLLVNNNRNNILGDV